MKSKAFLASRLGLALLLVLPLVAVCEPAEAADSSLKLGFASGAPAVYFTPHEGMKVRLSNITYDAKDSASAYDLEFVYPSGEKVGITLSEGSEADHESAGYRYKAEIAGKAKRSFSREEWKATGAEGLIAFSPEGMGGYVLHFSGSITQSDLENRFTYDSQGNRSFGEQAYTMAGTSYRFGYSEHQRDGAGNLTGYVAELITVAKAGG